MLGTRASQSIQASAPKILRSRANLPDYASGYDSLQRSQLFLKALGGATCQLKYLKLKSLQSLQPSDMLAHLVGEGPLVKGRFGHFIPNHGTTSRRPH